MEGISLREVIVHPLKGTRPISLDGWKAEQVAYKRVCNYGLPKERQRQAETAQSSLRSFWAVAWQSLGPGPSEGAAVRCAVIRFRSGHDHDTSCVPGFSTAWRRSAGGLLASARTGRAAAVDHSSGAG